MRAAYSIRKELSEKDKQLDEHRQSSSQNKNITPYQSHHNLIAEVDQKNRQNQQNLNQKRQSIFNMATNIDDFEAMKNYSKTRRLSARVKNLFVPTNSSNNNSMAQASSNSNLTAKVGPAEQQFLKV